MTSPFARIAAREALKSALGPGAEFSLYDRAVKTPMNFTLDLAVRHLGDVEVDVYWVESGPPELFCLPGLSPTPVVFSRRFLSIMAFIRRLFSQPGIDDVAQEMARRSTLKLMAEFALRAGSGDLAVELFVESIVGRGIWLDDSNEQARALEHEPKNESYMAVWFYGLLHELGHLSAAGMNARESLFSDRTTLQYLEFVLAQSKHYPEALKTEIRAQALRARSSSVVGIDTLRTEAMADLFAATVLLEASVKMAAAEQRSFDVFLYVQELLFLPNSLFVIDRCARMVKNALADRFNPAERTELLIHPSTALMVRTFMLRPRLELIVSSYLYGMSPSCDQIAEVSETMDHLNTHHLTRIDRVETGLARAMEFLFYPDRRAALLDRLESFRMQLAQDNGLDQPELHRFVALADELGHGASNLLNVLRVLLTDPKNMRFEAH